MRIPKAEILYPIFTSLLNTMGIIPKINLFSNVKENWLPIFGKIQEQGRDFLSREQSVFGEELTKGWDEPASKPLFRLPGWPGKVQEFLEPKTKREEVESAALGLVGGMKNVARKGITKAAPIIKKETVPIFKGLQNLSTKLLEQFRGMPNEITEQQFNEVINRAAKEGIRKADLDLIKGAAEGQVVKVLDDPLLAQEARKYKSAEEFVGAQIDDPMEGVMFHGGVLKAKIGDEPLFLAPHAGYAKTYGEEITAVVPKAGKTLDITKSEDTTKLMREIFASDKLQKTFNKIPNEYRYLDETYYGDEIKTLFPKSSKSDFDDWLLLEYQSRPILRGGLKVRTGSYSFEKETQKIRQELQNAFRTYGKPSREDVFAHWDEIIKYAKSKNYEYIKHLGETADKSAAFEEIVALNPKKSLSQLTDFYNQAVKGDRMINLSKIAAKVESQLVPITPTPVKSPRWAGSQGTPIYTGDGKYGEIVYQSPIKTSAGDVHFSEKYSEGQYHGGKGKESFPNYFSHVRYEDMANGHIRKIVEIQFDLRKTWEAELRSLKTRQGSAISADMVARKKELEKLLAYKSNEPLGEFRTFREEVKRAAKDGKDTILIPSGETAMKIEGLGQEGRGGMGGWFHFEERGRALRLLPNDLRVGGEIAQGGAGTDRWIITDILGDGKFKAMPKESMGEDQLRRLANGERIWAAHNNPLEETFDISGKIDTQHFVYKLNEEAIPREARKMGLEIQGKIKVDTGEWWKILIPKERARLPVEAFGAIPFMPIPQLFINQEQ